METLELILLALVLVFAGSILFSRRIRTAVALYMGMSLLLAILWGLQYGLRVAMTELGAGVVVTGLLFWFISRHMKNEKGPKDESEA